MSAYRIYGLDIHADVDLGLPPGDPDRHDLVVRRAPRLAPPAGRLVHRAEDFEHGPTLEVRADGTDLDLRYDGWRIVVRGDRIDLAEEGPHRSALPMVFERIVAPLVVLFRRRSVVGLHGGAVALDDSAWLVIGASGAGKSTTALELVRRGARLVADDLAVVDVAAGCLLPGGPALRLWREAGALEEAVADAPIAGDTKKRWFRLGDEVVATTPPLLAGVLLLEPAEPSPALGLDVERMSGAQALAALLAQSFDLSDPEPGWKRSRFAATAELSRRTPLWRVRYARDPQGRPTHIEPLYRRIGDLICDELTDP